MDYKELKDKIDKWELFKFLNQTCNLQNKIKVLISNVKWYSLTSWFNHWALFFPDSL